MKQSAMQELKWFISDGLDNFDESVKVSEIWAKINELLEMEKQQNKFTNSPIHDKKAIIKMMDELNPKEMSEVIDFIKLKLEIK